MCVFRVQGEVSAGFIGSEHWDQGSQLHCSRHRNYSWGRDTCGDGWVSVGRPMPSLGVGGDHSAGNLKSGLTVRFAGLHSGSATSPDSLGGLGQVGKKSPLPSHL